MKFKLDIRAIKYDTVSIVTNLLIYKYCNFYNYNLQYLSIEYNDEKTSKNRIPHSK